MEIKIKEYKVPKEKKAFSSFNITAKLLWKKPCNKERLIATQKMIFLKFIAKKKVWL